MKNKIFSFLTIVALLFAYSCKKENSERWQNLPEIKMLNAASTTDNIILLQGECLIDGGVSHNSSNCGYFFLCSSDGKTFSKSEIKAEYDSKKKKYTGMYTPSAEGTYYFKFCAVSIGRYSYIESKVLSFEYKPIDFSLPVDMGLPSGIMWASCNVGAKTPWEYGGYYQWAGTEDVTSTSINLNWSNCPYHTGKTETKNWAKYNSNSLYGTVDNKSVLDLSDDIAHVQLGEKWRMPTDAEWEELIKNCVWTLTTLGGSNGYNVTSPKTGNSIFFPAAGYRVDAERAYAGSGGYYWSSSLSTSGPYYACGVYFYSEELERYAKGLRYYGKSVRPVMDNSIVQVTGITVTPDAAEIEAGKTLQLTATVLPEDASDKSVTWSSSNTKVATVNAEGLVTAVSEGSALIYAITTDGEKENYCKLTVTPAQQVSEAVDLGLPSGTKWAQVNLGAKTPEDYGNYYAWGETEPNHVNGYSDYKFAATGSKIDYAMSGYCSSYEFGDGLDYRLVLSADDDAATASLKDGWRIPTAAEFQELLDNCSKKWDDVKKGYILTSTKNGQSIFLPAAGKREGGDYSLQGSTGYYWSMNIDVDAQRQARELFLSSGESPVLSSYSRWTEVSIRPVQGTFKRVEKVYLNENELSMKIGEQHTLAVSFYPAKPTVTNVTWVGNSSIATVDQNGVVTAVGPGTGSILVYSADGGVYAKCTVCVSLDVTDFAPVDLGLPSKRKWASCNLGATKPEEYGSYFALGDVAGQMWDGKYWFDGGFYKAVDYKLDSENNLLLQYDAAHVKLGGKWRMPTFTELKELFEYCSYTRCSINGVDGYLLKSKQAGYTDKHLFIPCAGYGYKNNFYNPAKGFYLWSATYIPNSGFYSIANGAASSFSYYDYNGLSIRAVVDDSIVPVTGVDVAPGSATIEAGKTLQLTATVLPENASDKSVTWSSSNTKVATVSAEGLVTAVSEGSALIYVITTDGEKENYCKLTVTPGQQVAETVDLGLSVKWATCNVGASKPEEYGGYYQWAGTQDVTSTSINLDWSNCPYHTGTSSGTGWTKYSHSDEVEKTVLEPEDDVAHIKLGGNWRMATDTEWKELIDNCTWTWTVQNKVHGYIVTSNIKGYTDKSIFLPACGYRNGTSLLYNDLKGDDESKIAGRYWSSTRSKEMYGRSMEFNSTSFTRHDRNRYYGYSIRPVSD